MGWLGHINEAIAVSATRHFGTIWVFYVFTVFGILPVLPFFKPYESQFLYWSNWVQLWALPLLLVGTNILGRSVEARAEYDHRKLVEMYGQIMMLIAEQQKVLLELGKQDVVLAEQTKTLMRELNILTAAKDE
jgi:hypothetical protein